MSKRGDLSVDEIEAINGALFGHDPLGWPTVVNDWNWDWRTNWWVPAEIADAMNAQESALSYLHTHPFHDYP